MNSILRSLFVFLDNSSSTFVISPVITKRVKYRYYDVNSILRSLFVFLDNSSSTFVISPVITKRVKYRYYDVNSILRSLIVFLQNSGSKVRQSYSITVEKLHCTACLRKNVAVTK